MSLMYVKRSIAWSVRDRWCRKRGWHELGRGYRHGDDEHVVDAPGV
jgi:hypothetical protein